MSESLRMWIEIVFNVAYLITVWALVVAMICRFRRVPQIDRAVAWLFIWAFALLALGDMGHVGFRVVAYALGGLDATAKFFGRDLSLIGLGSLATSVTVTLFYVLMVLLWRARFQKPFGVVGVLALVAAVVRLVILAFPQNGWGLGAPSHAWSLYRNLPLVIQGAGVAYLILRDALARHDRPFTWIGVMILVSYAFYTPVILWAYRVPLLGMLMIPKTMAYVVIAVIGYRNFFRR